MDIKNTKLLKDVLKGKCRAFLVWEGKDTISGVTVNWDEGFDLCEITELLSLTSQLHSECFPLLSCLFYISSNF